VALTVTFTVCDAQQIGLSPSGSFLLPNKNPASWQMMRPEQKAPLVLVSLRVSNQALANRKQATATFRYYDKSQGFRYALILPGCPLNTLCSQPNSGERTRGPPRMDPPLFC
jgi:hypothetical protein